MYLEFLQATGARKIEERSTEGETPEMKKMREEGWNSSADASFHVTNPNLLWRENRPPAGTEEYPVTLLTVHEADAYCRWLTQRFPEQGTFRLPTVDEWMTAAYGANRPQPWGTERDASRAHVGSHRPEPVRARPQGRTPEGIYGLWGNVSEFVIHPEELQDAHFIGVGGRWMGGSYRQDLPKPNQDYWGYWHNSQGRSQEIGFRVVLDPEDREHRFRHETPYDRERR